jgi:hypothetical protein
MGKQVPGPMYKPNYEAVLPHSSAFVYKLPFEHKDGFVAPKHKSGPGVYTYKADEQFKT